MSEVSPSGSSNHDEPMNAAARVEFKPWVDQEAHGGTQHLYRFANGYGASVIRHQFSYGGDHGLFELAVTKFPRADSEQWTICYDTPITNDVVGHLTDDAVHSLLCRIQELPPHSPDAAAAVTTAKSLESEEAQAK